MYSARWVSIGVHVGMRYNTRGSGDAELWLQSEGALRHGRKLEKTNKWVNPVGGFEEVAASSINAVQAEANSNDGERAWSETQWRMGQHWRSPIEQREG
jgi:hypothetical protein